MMTDDGYLQEKKPDQVNKVNVPRWIITLIFFIPVVLYLPGIFGRIPYPSASALYSDLMLTHYPNALYLRQAIFEYQQIPLWSNLIHSGAPFAANPLAGLFYLPGLLALVFPLPEGISFMLAAHAVFATWGMYLFLKAENVGEIGAVAGGLMVGLMPKISAHYGAGHVSLIYAISWTPWLLFISRRDQRGWKTGIIAALLFLADPRWAVYAGLIWFTFDIAHRHYEGWKNYFLYYLRAGFIAFLIASPLILPLYEYIGLSTRSRMGLEDIQLYSLPAERILGLVIPTIGSNPEWYIYFGGVALGLFLINLLDRKLRGGNRFWNIWILISFIIAMGSRFLSPDWLIKIPVVSLLRVPARAIFLVGFSFSVVAARSIEHLAYNLIDVKKSSKIAFGIALASFGLAVPITFILGNLSLAAVWGFGFLIAFSVILSIKRFRLDPEKWAWLVVGLLLLDLLGAGFQSYNLRDKEILHPEIIEQLENESNNFRVYSPSYSFPQYLAAENRMEIADGVDPLQIASYTEFMEKASGVVLDGYSVTIPGFRSGNPALDNNGTSPEPFLLSLLNVKYIVSGFEIDHPQFQLINSEKQTFLYKNTYSTPRAWVEEKPRSEDNYEGGNFVSVDNIEITPNRIQLTAQGPGRLVLSEIEYPGWTVMIDGKRQPIELAYGLLRSVNLNKGDHDIQFIFLPITVYLGLGLAVVGWALSVWQIYGKHANQSVQDPEIVG